MIFNKTIAKICLVMTIARFCLLDLGRFCNLIESDTIFCGLKRRNLIIKIKSLMYSFSVFVQRTRQWCKKYFENVMKKVSLLTTNGTEVGIIDQSSCARTPLQSSGLGALEIRTKIID